MLAAFFLVATSVARIWDGAPHNAFTDLIHFKDRWLCVFREGTKHVSEDGAVRILESKDGNTWTSAGRLEIAGLDVRDPKITLTSDGRLMVTTAAADRKVKPVTHQSVVWFSKDGRDWGKPLNVGELDFWLWRVQWHKGQAYSVGYTTGDRATGFTRLYRSRDGKEFETLVPTLFSEGYPNESSLVFLKDGTALCLLRRDLGSKTGQLGSAKPPYTEWTWKDLGVRIGGPEFIQIPGGRLIGVVRLYDGTTRTSIVEIHPEDGRLTELEKLPSSGDSSYAGLEWRDGQLWISYYSSHEGKSSIYLARWKP